MVDILAICAHPDDAELACSGTLLKHAALGYSIGILDLTRGELGSRGTAETRDQEAKESAEILGLKIRDNVGLADGFFESDEESLKLLISKIRLYKPKIILTNAPSDRHPDHGRASAFVTRANFLAGLIKIETELNGVKQDFYRSPQVYYFIQDRYLNPDFIVDITPFWEKKIESIKAFKTQFFNPEMSGVETPISSQDFWFFLEARARSLGRDIQVDYAEGFINSRVTGVKDLFSLI